MEKIYGVYHCYDDFDTCNPREDLICVFDSLEKAEQFKQKYSCKKSDLCIEELPTTFNEEYFWWLMIKPDGTLESLL